MGFARLSILVSRREKLELSHHALRVDRHVCAPLLKLFDERFLPLFGKEMLPAAPSPDLGKKFVAFQKRLDIEPCPADDDRDAALLVLFMDDSLRFS